MPKAGDTFEVELKPAHIQWGTRGQSRIGQGRSNKEAYIPISIRNARRYNILQATVFHAKSADGYFDHDVLASGSQGDNYEYSKQFHGYGNLKLIGYWLKDYCNAKPGDRVRVEFTSPDDILFTFIRI